MAPGGGGGGAPSSSSGRKQRVAYYYDPEFARFYFGQNHPMKPHRLAMTHQLVLAYGLHERMTCLRPRKATPAELAQFHSPEYVRFLERICPANAGEYAAQVS